MIRKMFAMAAAALLVAGAAFEAAAANLTIAIRTFVAWAWAEIDAVFTIAPSPFGRQLPTLASVAYADPSPTRQFQTRRLERESATPRQRTPARLAA